MYHDFYSTMAQVIPVVLLALVWDSNYLERLRAERRRRRRAGAAGVVFWTKSRVRVYLIVVTGLLVVSVGLSLSVLAGSLGDTIWLRAVLLAVLALALVTLFVRISVDIVAATRSDE